MGSHTTIVLSHLKAHCHVVTKSLPQVTKLYLKTHLKKLYLKKADWNGFLTLQKHCTDIKHSKIQII